jgi:hypothetical protein
MKRRCFIKACGSFILLSSTQVKAADISLVLVAASGSTLSALNANDVRKAFLGVPVSVNDKIIVPILNSSNSDAKELFLQRVLFMSGAVYERHSIGRVFRNGGNRLADYSDQIALANALATTPFGISFMLAADAKKTSVVKILGEL